MGKKIVFFVACINIMAVLARDCSRIETIGNCNDCFRCGGKWCKNPTEVYDTVEYRKSLRNALTLKPRWAWDYMPDRKLYLPQRDRCKVGFIPDDWCSNQIEQPTYRSDTVNGKNVPVYVEQTVKIGESAHTTINFKSKNTSWDYSVINSTQNANLFYIEKSGNCDSYDCTVNLEVQADEKFCSPTSDVYEYVNVKLKVEELEESTNIKYHVPCACECSKYPERNSDACSNHGDLVCGKCACNVGWTGDRCQANEHRGDIPCANGWNGKECSGNGKCINGACICRNDTRGHQYLSPNNDCIDICLVTELDYDNCVQFEKCPEKEFVNFVPKNEDLLEQRDVEDKNNFVWVKCVMDIDGCQKEYAVKKDNGNNWSSYSLYIMPLTSCDPVSVHQAGETNVYLPIILGILGVVAATAAVVGYVVWKNRSPPLPLTDPQYQNIDAEDCVGENPLYKPPTSSFKNPTYGKW